MGRLHGEAVAAGTKADVEGLNRAVIDGDRHAETGRLVMSVALCGGVNAVVPLT